METIKTTLLKWLRLPFAILAGIAYYLLKQNQGLKDELNNEKAERAVDGIKREIAAAKEDGDAKEADYRAALQQYHNDGAGE